jgi:hypothetical protein
MARAPPAAADHITRQYIMALDPVVPDLVYWHNHLPYRAFPAGSIEVAHRSDGTAPYRVGRDKDATCR